MIYLTDTLPDKSENKRIFRRVRPRRRTISLPQISNLLKESEVDVEKKRFETHRELLTLDKMKRFDEFNMLKEIFLENNFQDEIGIFRVSPSRIELEKFIHKMRRKKKAKKVSPHVLAGAVKFWVSKMGFKNRCGNAIFSDIDSENLIPNRFYENFEEIYQSLPPLKREVAYSFLELLCIVKRRKLKNKMDAKNLSIVVLPVLFEMEFLIKQNVPMANILNITNNLIENFPFIKKFENTVAFTPDEICNELIRDANID